MYASNQIHFIPGSKPDRDAPLERYLPPVHSKVVSSWLLENIPAGSWVIDPFGFSPDLLCEAAQNGYKVLVSINNPITRFILELRCHSPKASDFQAAIALLASSMVGRDRLEPHIKSLYETVCEGCGRSIQVTAFIWKRNATAPSGRIYTCPHCGDSGERSTTQFDFEKASQFAKHGLHWARALERVSPLHDPDRRHVEEALGVYLPRAIYALVTIINKLTSIPPSDPNSRLLSALLLSAFDRANTLWPYPKARQRPKQLTIPPQFLEHNIWLAIETAAKIWACDEQGVLITKWPQEPPSSGGICVFGGRIKALASNLSEIGGSTIVTSFPRPNQAFWTLSALWSGWLWGHEALEQFKSVLRRRRYDWSWHISALQSALNHLVTSLPPNTPFFGLINEVEPGFLSAVILGCQYAHLTLSGVALRAEENQAQVTWQIKNNGTAQTDDQINLEDTIISSTKAYLLERGEPCSYSYLHAAGLVGLVTNSNPPLNMTPGDYLSRVHAAFQDNMIPRNGYLRYAGSEKSLDVGLWWLNDPEPHVTPISDQVEIAFVKYLHNNPGCTSIEIDSAICSKLPGLSPPDAELIFECLQSYGVEEKDDPNRWMMPSSEHPDQRRADLLEMSQCLLDLGNKLGFEVSRTGKEFATVQWSSKTRKDYIFYTSASALLGRFIPLSNSTYQTSFIVIPGSRANLIAIKLRRNPYINQLFSNKWGFIKFRLIRQLVKTKNITPSNIEEYFALDPITYTTPQIRMF